MAKQLNQAIQKLLTDCAEVGFQYWGDAPGTGFAWAVDDRQQYHAVHSSTRGGARQSRHACGLMSIWLAAELERLTRTAFWQLKGWERVDSYREREITRLELALTNPTCDVDGPVIVHPVISTAAVEQIQIEVGS